VAVDPSTVKLAATSWNVTLVAPFNPYPRIVTTSPITPMVGRVFTNWGSPKDKEKIVPLPLAAPAPVVP
jgi:hypothetical protein